MLKNVMHVRDFTAVSHLCLHSCAPFHSGRKALSFTKRKNIGFKTDHDAITLFYSVQLLVMKYDSPEA